MALLNRPVQLYLIMHVNRANNINVGIQKKKKIPRLLSIRVDQDTVMLNEYGTLT